MNVFDRAAGNVEKKKKRISSKTTLKRNSQKRERKETCIFYAFISPFIIGFSVFTIFPMVMSLIFSVNKISILDYAQGYWDFIGFDNYKTILFGDNYFFIAMKNTFIFAFLRVFICVFVSLLVAVLLNSKIPGRKIFRTLIYIPAIVPVVGSSVLWRQLFDGRSSISMARAIRLIQCCVYERHYGHRAHDDHDSCCLAGRAAGNAGSGADRRRGGVAQVLVHYRAVYIFHPVFCKHYRVYFLSASICRGGFVGWFNEQLVYDLVYACDELLPRSAHRAWVLLRNILADFLHCDDFYDHLFRCCGQKSFLCGGLRYEERIFETRLPAQEKVSLGRYIVGIVFDCVDIVCAVGFAFGLDGDTVVATKRRQYLSASAGNAESRNTCQF